jgi:predicted phage terminase large subunit-like protein
VQVTDAPADLWEHAARSFEPPRRRWASPGELAAHLSSKTVQTPALDLIDQALVRVANTPDSRLIVCMAPQEGKSVRVAGDFPTWLLTTNPDLRIVTASYGQGLANRNGRAIRSRITSHPDLGLRIAPDHGAVHEWAIEGHEGGVVSVGVGAGVTGRVADVLIIDDPIKDRKEADSLPYRDAVWDWWTDSASTRLAPGAPVILILTRWHHDDLAGRLLAAEDGDTWDVINIPAQADHDPGKGETDLLGREPGQFMASARGRTTAQWEQRKRTAGPRTWASLYQGRPTPDAGNVLPADWWVFYDQPLWLESTDGVCRIPNANGADVELCQSWDFTFKDTKGSDFVVGQVWLRRGVDAFLLDQVRDRMTFTDSLMAIKAMSARWPQATAKLVEDKANGPAILNALRSQLGGLIPVEPEGSKYARAVAITPLVHAGNVHLPDPKIAPWVAGLVQEARDFPAAAHDDQVDALSQALHRLLLVPLLDGTLIESDDLLEEFDDYAGISPY